MYGSILKNPFKVVATSGCGTTKYQLDTFKELKDADKKIIIAFDSDEPGLKGLSKFTKNDIGTHYCLTNDSNIDWNDLLVELGPIGLAKYFLDNIMEIVL